MSWFSKLWLGLFSRRRRSVRKVPILGVEGSGKSSLLLTMGQYISLNRLGRVSLSSLVFGEYVSHVAAGRPLPPTMRHEPVELELERVADESGHRDVDLVLTTEDIPGQDFRMLVDELQRPPARGRKPSVLLQRFTKLLEGSAGFIFLVDVVRGAKPEAFAADSQRSVWRACADQVEPIMSALLLASRVNSDLAGKPVFFVFGKPDLHGLPPSHIAEDFERAMAIPLAQLRGKLVNVRLYHVQSAGWGLDSSLAGLGVDVLLGDLAYAVGAVRK